MAIHKLDASLYFQNAIKTAMKGRSSTRREPVPCRFDALVEMTRDISIADLATIGIIDIQSDIKWWRAELTQLLVELDMITAGTATRTEEVRAP